jgi:transcriptional regulator with XRE-family HTH domain
MANKEINSSDQQIVQSVGNMVRAFRLQRQLNVKQLSRLSGITQQTITHIETGMGSRVDLVKLCRLAESMEISVKEILEGGSIVSRGEVDQLQQNQAVDVFPLQPYPISNGAVGYSVPGAFTPTRPFITHDEMHIGLDGVTLEAWFYPMDPASNYEQKLLNVHEKPFHTIYLGWEDERVWFGIVPGVEDAWFKLRSGPCSLYEWHHVVGVCDGKVATLFVDQVEVGQVSIGDFSSLYFTDKLRVGFLTYDHNEQIDDPQQTFKGQITQPTVWTEPMSPFLLKKTREHMIEKPDREFKNHKPLKA